jgi:hypothetical protein
MRLNRNIVTVVSPKGGKDGKLLKGIMSMYQLRATSSTAGTRKIMYRDVTCWCSKCVIGEYLSCFEGSSWKEIDLEEVPKEVARQERIQKRLSEEEYDKRFRLRIGER